MPIQIKDIWKIDSDRVGLDVLFTHPDDESRTETVINLQVDISAIANGEALKKYVGDMLTKKFVDPQCLRDIRNELDAAKPKPVATVEPAAIQPAVSVPETQPVAVEPEPQPQPEKPKSTL